MMSRREFSLSLAPGFAVLSLAGCTNGQLDPAKIADAIKGACSIAVPIATITAIISATTGATVQVIVDLVCSAYHSSLQAKGLKASQGQTVDFVVVVNGKEIPVHATVQ